MSEATHQFYELVARRYCEIEEAKLERAEILLNMRQALERGEITQAQYDDLLETFVRAEGGRG